MMMRMKKMMMKVTRNRVVGHERIRLGLLICTLTFMLEGSNNSN